MMLMMTPERIRELRERLGLTPTEFAAKVGVSASTICNWESGSRHPRYDAMLVLNRLAEETATNGRRKKATAGAR